MLVICGLLVAFSLTQPPQSIESTGRIDGRVTIEGTNTGVAGVRIMLFPFGRNQTGPPIGRMGPMGGPPETVTDQDGRFAFPRILPGTYRVDAQKTGLVSLSQSDRPTTIDVVADRTSELRMQMQKGAAITGRVLDPSGEPLPDVSVMVMHHVDRPGGMPSRLLPAGGQGQQTNDLGEFRISGVPPGEYFVVAMPRGRSPFGGPAVAAPSGNGRQSPRRFMLGLSTKRRHSPLP